MLNKVMIIGRLGADPDLRYVAGGQPVTTLNVATDESYTDRDGNKIKKTEWHRINVWGKSAENCKNFLGKGSLVYVEGSLQTRKWQDQQGVDRYVTEIRAQKVQFLDRKGEGKARDDGNFGQESDFDRPHPDNEYAEGHERGVKSKNSGRKGSDNEDVGPIFPSEANALDHVPF